MIQEFLPSLPICADYLKANNESISLPPKTRWLYNFEMVTKFLAIKPLIDHCCDSILIIDSLSLSKTLILEKALAILGYYKECTELLQYSKSQTLSNVIPVLIGLESHLENFKASENKIISNFS